MNFNQSNLPPHLQQQLQDQLLQQQGLNPQNPTRGLNTANLTIQQQQQLAAAIKQQAQQQQLQHHKLQAQHHQQKMSSLQETAAQSPLDAQRPVAAGGLSSPLPSLDYWSKKLDTPNTDVLIYEQLISRDLANKELTQLGAISNKQTVAKLYANLKFFNDLKMARMKTIQYSNQGQYTKSIWGDGYQGYGNGFTDGPTRVLIPNERKKPTRLNDINISKATLDKQAYLKEDLVPLRLDFEGERDKFRLRDTLLWNLNDQTMTVENLVAMIMEDYQFGNPLLGESVLTSIKEQISDYHRHVYNTEYGDDLRVLIKLDITISNNQFVDQFEWDISNPENSPEEFAECMCEELSLPGEFGSAIAHSIREQAQIFTKSLYLSGYDFKGGLIEEEDIRSHVRGIVTHKDYLRPKPQLPQYTPQMLEVSNLELERLDKVRERDSRRKRRQGRTGRRGGPTLPDLSDIPRTFRTPVPSTTLPGGIDCTDSVASYDEYFETINKPVTQSSTSAQNIAAQQTQAKGYTPRSQGRTLQTNQKVMYIHERGSRLLVRIKL